MDDQMDPVDCAVIGGGTAGMAAAMVLVRARRRTVLIDAGEQNNRRSGHAGGVFLHDGEAPSALYEEGLRQLSRYPTFSHLKGRVTSAAPSAAPTDGAFELTTDTGATVSARKLVLAQGVTFAPSPIPGVDALWGTKAVHCPFCDGYESRDMRVLVIGELEWLEHMRLMLPNWVDDLTWAELRDVDRVDEDDAVQGVYTNGTTATFDRLFVQQKYTSRDSLADDLGCARTESGHLAVDESGQTSIAGVFAAGDQTTPPQQVNLAVGAGHRAGMGVVLALSTEDRGA